MAGKHCLLYAMSFLRPIVKPEGKWMWLCLMVWVLAGMCVNQRPFLTPGSAPDRSNHAALSLVPVPFPPPARQGFRHVLPPQRQQPATSSGTAGETVVTLQFDGEQTEITTMQPTVGAALAEARIGLGPLDQVTPSLQSAIVPDLVIRVWRVRRDVLISDETVPYQTRWIGDEALALDRQIVRVQGANGLERTRTLVTYREGDEAMVEHAASWLAQAPVHKQIAYGRRIARLELELADGSTIAYWRKVRMYATSYSTSRAGTSPDAPWYGFTYSGHRMGSGIVATHGWIPLCTHLFVPDYGQGQVLDRGSGLGVYDIDLGYTDEDWRHWSKGVDVYLLWPPPADPARISWILPAPGAAWQGSNANPDCVSGRLRSKTDPCNCAPP